MTKETKPKAAPPLDPLYRDLAERVTELERQMAQVSATLAQLPAAGRMGPITQQGYLAGQWHRRDGTVYGAVAARGQPNADDPSGAVPPPVKRGGGHQGAR